MQTKLVLAMPTVHKSAIIRTGSRRNHRSSLADGGIRVRSDEWSQARNSPLGRNVRLGDLEGKPHKQQLTAAASWRVLKLLMSPSPTRPQPSVGRDLS